MNRHAKAIVAALTLLACLGAATALADSPPSLTIKDPSAVKYASAHLSGTVDPEGGPSSTFWHFEFREASLPEEEASWTQSGGDQEVPAETEGSPTGVSDVVEDFGGFKPGTEYLVRLVASNEDGANRVVSGSKALTTDVVAKPSAAIDPVTTFTGTTAHFSGTVSAGGSGEGEATGSYRFECEPSCGGLGGEQSIEPVDAASHTVEADATELQPNTPYKVKLFARNVQTDTEGEAVVDEVEFTTSPVAPEVFTTTNTPEAGAKVTVRGFLNPRNAAITECHFDYGSTESYGQSAPCEGSLPSGSDTVLVDATLSGLTPGATYHYRVVAESAGGPAQGEDATFTVLEPAASQSCANEARREEQHSTFLPDCRAFEMVSPAEKDGADVIANTGATRGASSGDAVSFASLHGFGDAPGTGVATEYISRRTGAAGTQGWSTHSIFPSGLEPLSFSAITQGKNPSYRGELSEDLSKGIFSTLTPLTGDPSVAAVSNIFLREDLLSPGANSNTLISTCPVCQEPPESKLFDPEGTYQPFPADATPDFHRILFEATKNLTSNTPAQTGFACLSLGRGCKPHLYEWDHGTVRLAGVLPGGAAAPISIAGTGAINKRYTANTISEDGSRLFFTAPSTSNGRSGLLYMRTDNGEPDAETVQLNVSEPETEVTAGPATFQGATPDGSKAFFTAANLNEDGELYRYDADAPAEHHLTEIAPGVPGVLGTSDDGETAYFLSSQTLLPDQAPPPPSAPLGIYVWHAGQVGFIGSVNSAGTTNRGGAPWNISPLTARVTPGGGALLFSASFGSGLTGYDHGGLDIPQLYLYDRDPASLTCASCNPSGAPATAPASFTEIAGAGATGLSAHLNHPLSDDGDRAFFNSGESLVPEDTNSKKDVYAYDAETGQLELLSSGTSPANSYFLEASPSGRDVFFTTYEALSGWDADNNADLYDARAGGGLPQPLPLPLPCTGEGCKGTPPISPAAPSAGSAQLAGPANPPVKRKRKARHRHKRHGTKRAAHGNREGNR